MITLKELADKVNGKLIGDGAIIISTVDDIKFASSKSIAFAFLPKYKKEISSSNAAAFVVTSDEDLDNNSGIVVENPYLSMITILDFFDQKVYSEDVERLEPDDEEDVDPAEFEKKKDIFSLYESEMEMYKQKAEDEEIKGYEDFEGIEEEWEDFNQRDSKDRES